MASKYSAVCDKTDTIFLFLLLNPYLEKKKIKSILYNSIPLIISMGMKPNCQCASRVRVPPPAKFNDLKLPWSNVKKGLEMSDMMSAHRASNVPGNAFCKG